MFDFDRIVQTPDDGRVLALDGSGNALARARWYGWRGEWRWVTDQVSVDGYTIRELADAGGLTISSMGRYDTRDLDDPEYVDILEKTANKYILGGFIYAKTVFGAFREADWGRMLSNWDKVAADLNAGRLPDGFYFAWEQTDKAMALAEGLGMRVRVNGFFYGKDVPDSVRNPKFGREELEKIVEFMLKVRMIKYRGRVEDWSIANEAAADIVIGHGQPNGFWYDRLGEEILDKVFRWARETDPQAELIANEDHYFENDVENFRRINAKFVELLRHYKTAGVPVDKVAQQGNLWIQVAPGKAQMITAIESIKSLGYAFMADEVTVNMANTAPFWTNRRPSRTISDPLQEQAVVYRNLFEACLETGSEFGFGGQSDRLNWLAQVGYPETKPMVFDEASQPKPAYFAIRDSLKKYLGL